MKSSDVRKQSINPIWIARFGFLVCFGLLVLWSIGSRSASRETQLLNVHNRVDLVEITRGFARDALVEFARFQPLGFLAVLSLPTYERWIDRIIRCWLPAVTVSLVIATVVAGSHSSSPFSLPGPFNLVFPWMGCLIGCWAGLAWTRGKTALMWFLAQLAILGAILMGCLFVLVNRAIEREPLRLHTPSVSSDDKRRLYALFSGKNPLNIDEGQTVELRLASSDVNQLLAWGLSVEGSARHALVELSENKATINASTPLPMGARYLNITAEAGLDYNHGRLDLRADQLRIGRVQIPTSLLMALSAAVSRSVSDDPRVRPMLALLQRIQLQNDSVVLTYGHGVPPAGFVASLFHEPTADQGDIPGIKAQILNLIAVSSTMPSGGDARFGATVQAAFRWARAHSSTDRAVAANRDAVLALGIVLGHPRVETLVGPVLDPAIRIVIRHAFEHTTLRRRDDWPKHFFVSAALTVIAENRISNASGLLKEEKDAAGGSGFSFGDLLADRAGTTFAEVATRSEASAHALQERLARGFNVDDYFPVAQGLTENLQDAEFNARFGGVGGEGYRRVMAEIERRVANCAAYQGVDRDAR